MISRFKTKLKYTKDEEKHLGSLKPHEHTMWDSPPDDIVKELKVKIRDQLLNNQKFICAYCGLDLGGTSEGQTEHIAPKAKYKEFTFEKDNLAMACHYCNGWSKKGNYQTISLLTSDYSKCIFKLVHPYYDDPSDHFDWVSKDRKVLILLLSEKGRYSNKIFKLDDPRMAELRGKKIIAEIVLSSTVTPQINDKLIQEAINYKQ